MTKIVASASQLRSASSQIEGIAAQYQSTYNQLLSTASSLASSWQGEDNQAFAAKVESLRDDFDEMYRLLVGCQEDLMQSATEYERAQSEVVSKAQALVSDF